MAGNRSGDRCSTLCGCDGAVALRRSSRPSLFDELLALRGDVGARSVIARHASVVVEEPMDWLAPRDVDTLEDLDQLSQLGTNAMSHLSDR